MPISTNTRLQANIIKNKYYLLNQHIVECYNKLSKQENIYPLIKQHKRLINELEIHTKKKPKTLSILLNYANTKNKVMALYIMTNTLNNRKLFSITT